VSFNGVIEDVGRVIDAIGVAAIVIGSLVAASLAARQALDRQAGVYRGFRDRLGRAILLGLELLVAADIIRTVAATPTLKSVAILGGIVLIRTFLSWSLEVEISGTLPWRKNVQSHPPPRGQTQPADRPPPDEAVM
jgi:uncharacterized membrane protein